MTQEELVLVKKIVSDAAVYVPADSEGIRIHYLEDDYFVGEGDETCDEYQVEYSEVDLENDMFYKIVMMDIGDYRVE